VLLRARHDGQQADRGYADSEYRFHVSSLSLSKLFLSTGEPITAAALFDCPSRLESRNGNEKLALRPKKVSGGKSPRNRDPTDETSFVVNSPHLTA
jgi:hypothetical protein